MFLDSYFKCNTRVPVVGTDSRIKHLAFRSQVFFLAGGSTHLEPCVSPDHWCFGNRFVWGNIAGWVHWCSHSALFPKNGKGGKNRFSLLMLWLFWCAGRTLCRCPWWWCALWLYVLKAKSTLYHHRHPLFRRKSLFQFFQKIFRYSRFLIFGFPLARKW